MLKEVCIDFRHLLFYIYMKLAVISNILGNYLILIMFLMNLWFSNMTASSYTISLPMDLVL